MAYLDTTRIVETLIEENVEAITSNIDYEYPKNLVLEDWEKTLYGDYSLEAELSNNGNFDYSTNQYAVIDHYLEFDCNSEMTILDTFLEAIDLFTQDIREQVNEFVQLRNACAIARNILTDEIDQGKLGIKTGFRTQFTDIDKQYIVGEFEKQIELVGYEFEDLYKDETINNEAYDFINWFE